MNTKFAAIGCVLLCYAATAQVNEQTRMSIDQLTGAKGTYSAEEDVHRVSFPRADLKVTIEGRAASPFLGFASWAAFTTAGHGRGTIVMGDIVLLEDEVSPAMSAALDNGLEVTALHNHFFYEQPRVMYMHIGGSGDAAKLASAVRKVLDAQGAVRTGSADAARTFPGGIVPAENNITGAKLEQILGTKGEANSGMFKVTMGRSGKHHDAKISKLMGLNTWAAFAGTDDMASVDGDFATTAGELQSVLKTLRKNGIHIVAIHNHMTGEEPQFIFLHYWGKGPAATLATAIRNAMDTQSKQY